MITEKMKSGEIRFSDDELEFEGNLNFYECQKQHISKRAYR